MTIPKVYKTEAIVLRRRDFGEADRILTLYTPYLGKLRAVAKGVRKPTSKLGGDGVAEADRSGLCWSGLQSRVTIRPVAYPVRRWSPSAMLIPG